MASELTNLLTILSAVGCTRTRHSELLSTSWNIGWFLVWAELDHKWQTNRPTILLQLLNYGDGTVVTPSQCTCDISRGIFWTSFASKLHHSSLDNKYGI